MVVILVVQELIGLRLLLMKLFIAVQIKMPQSPKLNYIILGIVGLILVASFNISPSSKVEAQANSTKLMGYAWSENIGWISFSSEIVQAAECVPASPLTQTIAGCPAGQTGTITQTRTSTCPGPVTSAWTTTSNTCVTPCIPESELTQTLSCPSGQIGSITQTKNSTCAPGATNPTYGVWVTTSNTCVTCGSSGNQCPGYQYPLLITWGKCSDFASYICDGYFTCASRSASMVACSGKNITCQCN